MELVKLSSEEFKKFADSIYEKTGIFIPESKLDMLSNRLRRRLRALKLAAFTDYYDLLQNDEACEKELPHFLAAVTTNETYFFRNEKLWKFFREKWMPDLIERKKRSGSKTIRIWSAASSSGEEAYTAAICLRESLAGFSAWNVQIVGSDISRTVLDKASSGVFNEYAISRTPPKTVSRWFTKKNDSYELKSEIHKLVKFQFHNLRDAFPEKNFDLIFLRNVLMYFDNAMKIRVLNHLTNALTCGGNLIIGDVDPIRSTPELREAFTLDYCGPNVYLKPEGATVGREAMAK